MNSNFMLLGLMSTIANAIGKAIGAVVSTIISPILKAFIPLVVNFVSDIINVFVRSGSLASIGILLWTAVKILIEGVLELTIGKEKMVNVTLDFASKSFTQMTDNELIKMLSWTPINYITRGDSSKVTETLVNPYYLSIKFMKEGVMPTAMTIFALIVMIELFQITVRTEGMRNSGFESPFKLMIKVAICKILLDNTQMILEAIFGTATDLFLKLYGIAQGIDLSKENWGEIKTVLMNLDWFTLIVLWLQMSVQLLAVWAVMLIIPFIIFARVIEMYIMIVLSPIPFATFASQEFSQIGKNFIKQFIGISFKIAVIYVIILVYSLMINLVTFDISNTEVVRNLVSTVETLIANGLFWAAAGVFFSAIGVKPILFAIMLLMSIMGADKYTKQITGAWY